VSIGEVCRLALFLFLTVSARRKRVEIYSCYAGSPRGKEGYPMIKMLVTKAVISKGYEGAPALRFSENAENPSVRFRIGMLVYDKRAEKEHRFVNISVKAFGYLVDRIKNMKLDAGTYVNIIGRYDEDVWEDRDTSEKKSAPVLIVDEIEYSANGGGNGKQTGENGSAPAGDGDGHAQAPAGNAPPANNGQPQAAPPATGTQPQAEFTGFEGFGGANPYYPEG